MFSSKQRDKLEAGLCPYCGAKDSQCHEQSSDVYDLDAMSQYIVCEKCGKTWWEVYSLVDYCEIED